MSPPLLALARSALFGLPTREGRGRRATLAQGRERQRVEINFARGQALGRQRSLVAPTGSGPPNARTPCGARTRSLRIRSLPSGPCGQEDSTSWPRFQSDPTSRAAASTQEFASAGNRTRVTSMATMYSATRPLMQPVRVMCADCMRKPCLCSLSLWRPAVIISGGSSCVLIFGTK